MKKVIFLILPFFLFVSCRETEAIPAGNTFYFENPQPINDSELKSFPHKFLGRYMSKDSIYINFIKNAIFMEVNWKEKISNTDLDSLRLNFDFFADKIVSKDKSWEISYRKLKDSIEIYDKKIDTIFRFSNTQKAKRLNGSLIISRKDSMYWNVKLYSLGRDYITTKELYSDFDLKKMDSITKVKAKMVDSLTFIITPSWSEFRQFLKLKDFGYNTHYKKVKE